MFTNFFSESGKRIVKGAFEKSKQTLQDTLQGFQLPQGPIAGAVTSATGAAPGMNLPELPPLHYQVGLGDQGMATVAAGLGIPLNQLIEANNGVKSLPPPGSYIRTNRNSDEIQRLIKEGVPPAVAAQIAGGARQSSSQGITGAPQSYAAGEKDYAAMQNFQSLLQNQINQGIIPTSIPASLLANLKGVDGRPVTPQAMTDAGWQLDASGHWIPPGGSGIGAPGAGGDNPNAGKVYYSKSRGYVTREVAGLLNKRRRRHAAEGNRLAAERAAAAAVTPGATLEGPSTVLDLNLGSG